MDGEKQEPKLRQGDVLSVNVKIHQMIRLRLGTYRTSKELAEAVFSQKFLWRQSDEDNRWDRRSLEQVPVSEVEREINLVVLSTTEIPSLSRFLHPCSTPCQSLKTVRSWGMILGLDDCPAEVGPQLFLQHTFRSCLIPLHVVMEPVHDKYGERTTFVIAPDDDKRKIGGMAVGESGEGGHWDEGFCVFQYNPLFF